MSKLLPVVKKVLFIKKEGELSLVNYYDDIYIGYLAPIYVDTTAQEYNEIMNTPETFLNVCTLSMKRITPYDCKTDPLRLQWLAEHTNFKPYLGASGEEALLLNIRPEGLSNKTKKILDIVASWITNFWEIQRVAESAVKQGINLQNSIHKYFRDTAFQVVMDNGGSLYTE